MHPIRISILPVTIALLGLLLTAGAVQAREDDAGFAELVTSAMQLQQAGNYTAAAEAYRQALSAKPDDIATEVNLGVVLVQLGRFDEAITQYQAALKQLPEDRRILLNIALAYEKSGRVEEARNQFEQLHFTAPSDKKVILLLADSELQLGHEQRVVDLLEPLAAAGDEDLGLTYMLGIASLRTGRMTEGQVLLDRILREGNTAEANFLLGTRMFESGDYPAAVQQLAKAAELNPKLPQLESLYGRALLNTGDPESATTAFYQALGLYPKDYQANLGMAQVLIAREQFKEALPFALRASQVRADSAEAQLAMAECLGGLKHYREAKPYAEAASEAFPASAEAHQTMAKILGGLGQTQDAKRERLKAQAIEATNDPGPKTHERAPDFNLTDMAGDSVQLKVLREKQPVVLVFGSYSCPNFRDAAPVLIHFYREYGKQVSFLLIYIREAHSSSNWQSTRNAKETVALDLAGKYSQKQEYARACQRKLHLPFRTVVDGMDGAVEKSYNAWPSRVYVIASDGRIRYRSRLTELDFHPAEMEEAVKQVIR